VASTETNNISTSLERYSDKAAIYQPMSTVGMVQWSVILPCVQRLHVQRPSSTYYPRRWSRVESPVSLLSGSIFYIPGDWPCIIHELLRWRVSFGPAYFYLLFFYYNKYAFSINNRQPKSWWSRQHFGTSWARVPVNKGVLERPRPPGSSSACAVWSVGCYDFRNDHLVSSIGWRLRLECCWLYFLSK
jgi:hypothetical protein